MIFLFASCLYHLQKLENKSQVFLDASRSDYLSDDSRSLQQKIQLAISSHEFKQITFAKENVVVQPSSISHITLSKPILASTTDPDSAIGYAYFTFSLAPAIAEGLFAWILISLILLLVIPLIQKYLANQIRLDLETQQAKALATLATQVAHDIRSPLSTIQMISAAPDLNTAEARELMNAAATRIDEIAQDLVDTAKRNKISKLDVERVELMPLLNSLVTAKRLEFKKDDAVTIQVQAFEGLKILANKKELNRVLSNLINNATEAKKSNQIQINITAEKKNADIVISVSDNGTGMPQSVINDILKGQHQSTKTGRSGLGLGLKHAIQAVQQMDGRIAISSQMDQGTTIMLSFISQ
ncbi:sensor histidine kinase [Pseudobdellovibrio sp. HCB154]|uniref:sensor histidine kinase n=1 Tax=Pseudobdellovibrio sp. HCB154 TaxID=3386277 RepID=UPI003916D4F9